MNGIAVRQGSSFVGKLGTDLIRHGLSRGPANLVAPTEWDEAVATACRVTGNPSSPAEFVSALWQQRNQLRFAIHYAGIQPDGAADLERIVRSLGWAAKWILRALHGDGKTSKKSTAERAGQRGWSINAYPASLQRRRKRIQRKHLAIAERDFQLSL